MIRLFRLLGIWTFIIGLLAMAGSYPEIGYLFFFQTAAFILLAYMRLSERTYLLIFWGYLILSFTGLTYWTFFQIV
ncbi:MAG: hypothetical protein A2189_09945 [Paenibacillus sp. RIFOXYA1_FULL_44_5]|nr:MAG: hypothetical protein A2189_09945 [Paenibacillus sp. RIFOXYA1_FULL_44_5]